MKGPAWPVQRIDLLRKLWREDLTAIQIGERMNLSKGAVLGKACRLGLPSRAPGSVRTHEPRPSQVKFRNWTPDEVQTVIRMDCEGAALAGMADALGKTVSSVEAFRRRLREVGLLTVPVRMRAVRAAVPKKRAFVMNQAAVQKSRLRGAEASHRLHQGVLNGAPERVAAGAYTLPAGHPLSSIAANVGPWHRD